MNRKILFFCIYYYILRSSCKEFRSCDGTTDCEDGLENVNCNETCGLYFKCNNGTVNSVTRNAYCDGIWDCSDGSDEFECQHKSCPDKKILCQDKSTCVSPIEICDGKYDCRDHSDEYGCTGRHGCEQNGKFFCEPNLCLDASLKCDGSKDCGEDGKDEYNCTCAVGEHKCSNGDCVEKENVCDGAFDCTDRSDEWSCVKVDENGVVLIYNPTDENWAVSCFDPNGSEGDNVTSVDHETCQRLGLEGALNSSSLSVIPEDSTKWVIGPFGNHSFSNHCESSQAKTVVCKEYHCSTKSNGNKLKAGTPYEIQSLVALTLGDKQCVAEIISPLWLLTSSDCVGVIDGLVNASIWFNDTHVIGEVEEIISHPHSSKFRSLFIRDFDLALIRLKTAINFNETLVNAICLPTHKVDLEITCFGIGPSGGDPVAYMVRDSNICNRPEHYNESLSNRHLCTNQQRKEGHDSDYLPPGSPLICLSSSSEWFLAGFLSYYHTHNNSYLSHPTVFSSSFSMKSFVEKVTGIGLYNSKCQPNIYSEAPQNETRSLFPEVMTSRPDSIRLPLLGLSPKNLLYTYHPLADLGENRSDLRTSSPNIYSELPSESRVTYSSSTSETAVNGTSAVNPTDSPRTDKQSESPSSVQYSRDIEMTTSSVTTPPTRVATNPRIYLSTQPSLLNATRIN